MDSGEHPVTFPAYTNCFLLPWCYSSMEPKDTRFSASSREDTCCSTYRLQRREGGREREKLCAFPASPSPQLCAPARCKVTLSSYMCGLKDYKTESGWMVPFFSPPIYGTPIGFPGCSLYRLMSNRSEEAERLFTCQPQSSGCVVSPAAADDSLTP